MMNVKTITILAVAASLLLPSCTLAKPRVERTDKALTIRFDNGIKIEVQFLASGNLRGIGRIWCKDTLLKTADVPARALVETAETDYVACKLTRTETKGDTVVLHTELLTDKGPTGDTLKWVFRPHRATIRNAAFEGFGYAYEFASEKIRVNAILDISSWAPGGTLRDTWAMESGDSISNTFKVTLRKDRGFNLMPASMFCSTHFCFRFLYGPGGLLFTYLAYPSPGMKWLDKNTGDDYATYYHLHRYSRPTSAKTPEKIVLFAPSVNNPTTLRVEDWHGTVYDYVHAKHCAHYGAKPPPVYTTCIKSWQYCCWHDAAIGNRGYIDTAKKWGFQAIWQKGWLDASTNRRAGYIDCLRNYRVSVNAGGEDMWKDWCDYAEKNGIKIIAWMPTCWMGGENWGFIRNPDWATREHRGFYEALRFYRKRGYVTGYPYYSEMLVGKAHSGYGDYLLRSYQHLVDMGVDGVWMDSYAHNAESEVFDENSEFPAKHFKRLHEIQGALLRRGVQVQYEGSGALGITGAGSVQPIIDNRLHGYRRVYGWAKLYWARRFLKENEVTDVNYYYKSCANRIPCGIVTSGSSTLAKPIHPQCPRKLGDWIVQANKDYKVVYDYMQYRTLIPSDADPEEEKAVQWTTDDGKTIVLWSYEPFDYDVPKGLSVKDVTAGRTVSSRNGNIRTEAWHTYLVTK